MAEKRLKGQFEQLDDGEYVSLVEFDGDLDEHEPITVDLDQWEDFIEKARSMGWDRTRMYVLENSPVLAREQGDDGDVFVALAPMVVDGNVPLNEDGDAKESADGGGDDSDDDW